MPPDPLGWIQCSVSHLFIQAFVSTSNFFFNNYFEVNVPLLKVGPGTDLACHPLRFKACRTACDGPILFTAEQSSDELTFSTFVGLVSSCVLNGIGTREHVEMMPNKIFDKKDCVFLRVVANLYKYF